MASSRSPARSAHPSLSTCFSCISARRAMGVFTVLTVNGSHIVPVGRFGQFLGWRWCFKCVAICNGIMLLVLFFAFPETLFVPASRTGLTAQDHPSEDQGNGIGRLSFRRYVKQLKLLS